MKKLFVLTLSIFVISVFSVVTVIAQNNNSGNDNIGKIIANKTEFHFKFSITSKEEISKLTTIISIDKVVGNQVYAYANQAEFAKFLQLNYNFQLINSDINVDNIKMLDNLNSKQIDAWDAYPTYTTYDSLMTRFQLNYPNLCRTFSIKTLTSGRKLLFVKISDNPDVTENEPKILYTSSIHGNELSGYVLMLHLIDYLLSNYGSNSRITNIVNNTEIWICPLANPDGAFKGGNSSIAMAQRYNGNNIDLNRNYPDPQAGQHPDGNAWQPETMAFMALADSIQFTMSANFHDGSELFNYPWDTWAKGHADSTWWNYVGREFADTIHLYSPSTYFNDMGNGVTNGYAWYTITGGRQDYMNYYKHCREVTIELTSGQPPAASTLPTYWNYCYHSFLNYIEQGMYGIKGIVTDSVTGNPLKAKIFIQGHDMDSSHVYSVLPLGSYFRPIYTGNYNVTYSSSGYYSKTINVAVSNKSSLTKDVKLVPLYVNIQDIEDNNLISLFPNPAQNTVIVSFNKNTVENSTLELIDVCGKCIYRNTITSKNNIQTIDLSGFAKGIYFVKLQKNNQLLSVKKLIIN
ncbi:MAG: M14 family zinc carboxypeptidase [Bacteroidetes bacterium]|nr:M14 family zinc carboxypeptidase [Bacteroidota bacterium]